MGFDQLGVDLLWVTRNVALDSWSFNALQRLPAAFECLPGFLSIHTFGTEKISAVLAGEEGTACPLLFAVAVRGLWSLLAKSDFP